MRIWILFIILLSLPANSWATGKKGEDYEVYHILQKGFITVQGKTNFFDFKGRALKHEGELEEENDLYSGEIVLRFSDLDFNLPGVHAILEKKDYIDAKQYPEIRIKLVDFHPGKKPKAVKSTLSLRGVAHPIVVNTLFDYVSPVVKVEGSFILKQSEWGIQPYSKGLMDMEDDLAISFKVFFCEVHLEKTTYHKPDHEAFAKLMEADNIQILHKSGFFGCSELEDHPPGK